MYSGKLCNEGIITVSAYPQLTVNETSSFIKMQAKPDDYIQITPFLSNPDDAVFKPATFYIRKTSTEVYFNVTAKKSCTLLINYKVTGANAAVFRTLKSDLVYATTPRLLSQPVNITSLYFDKVCRNKFPTFACESFTIIIFKSSCSWPGGSNGFVTVTSSTNQNIPLSLLGISNSAFLDVYRKKLVDPKDEIEKFLKTRIVPLPCSSCSGINLNTDTVNYIVYNNYFERTMFKVLSDTLPFGFNIHPGSGPLTSVENLRSTYGIGTEIKKVRSCSMLPLISVNAYVLYQPRMPMVFQFLSSRKNIARPNHQYCIAIDLCKERLHVALPNGVVLDFTSDFNAFGLKNIKVTANGFSLLRQVKCLALSRITDKCVKADFKWNIKAEFRSIASTLLLDGSIFIDHGNKKTHKVI